MCKPAGPMCFVFTESLGVDKLLGTGMKTPLLSILLFVVAAIFGAVGQFLYKSGADAGGGSLRGYLLNWRIACGVACYAAVTMLPKAA